MIYLDHGLASSSLAGQVTGAAEWHINADEPDVLDYDTSFKPGPIDAIYAPDRFRSSDHDPVLIGLELVDTELSATVTPKKPRTGQPAAVVVDVKRADGAEATAGTVTVLRDGEVVGTAEVTECPVRVAIEPFTWSWIASSSRTRSRMRVIPVAGACATWPRSAKVSGP